MKKVEFERMLCDDLCNIMGKKNSIELNEHLHYVNTFERLEEGVQGDGVKIILHDGSIFKLKIEKIK